MSSACLAKHQTTRKARCLAAVVLARTLVLITEINSEVVAEKKLRLLATCGNITISRA